MNVVFIKDEEGDVFRVDQIAAIRVCKDERKSYVKITLITGDDLEYTALSRKHALNIRDEFIEAMDASIVDLSKGGEA
jgi:hypothetical protein